MDPVEKARIMVESAEDLGVAAAKLWYIGDKEGSIAVNVVIDMILLDLAEHNEIHFPITTRR